MATKTRKASQEEDSPSAVEDLINESADRIKKRHGTIQWEIGDELRELVDQSHQGDVAVAKFSEALDERGVSYGRQMLQAMLAVSRAFPQKSKRKASLSWQHYHVVGQRPDRDEWIQRTIEEGWSSKQLESQIEMAHKDEREGGEGFHFWF